MKTLCSFFHICSNIQDGLTLHLHLDTKQVFNHGNVCNVFSLCSAKLLFRCSSSVWILENVMIIIQYVNPPSKSADSGGFVFHMASLIPSHDGNALFMTSHSLLLSTLWFTAVLCQAFNSRHSQHLHRCFQLRQSPHMICRASREHLDQTCRLHEP